MSEDKELRASLQKDIRDYYNKHIKGRNIEDIPEEWEHYSSWYQDLYGIKPVVHTSSETNTVVKEKKEISYTSVYDEIRAELRREKLSNQYFDYSNAISVVNRVENMMKAREKQADETKQNVSKQSDSERLKSLIEFVYKNSPATLEEVLLHYMSNHCDEFNASRVNALLITLNNAFLVPRIMDAEHAINVACEHAMYLKAYCEGGMYTTEEDAKLHAPVQAKNAEKIMNVCNNYRKGKDNDKCMI